jgi:hypothetical protein
MSVPALSSYLQASLMEVFIDNMLWCVLQHMCVVL